MLLQERGQRVRGQVDRAHELDDLQVFFLLPLLLQLLNSGLPLGGLGPRFFKLLVNFFKLHRHTPFRFS